MSEPLMADPDPQPFSSSQLPSDHEARTGLWTVTKPPETKSLTRPSLLCCLHVGSSVTVTQMSPSVCLCSSCIFSRGVSHPESGDVSSLGFVD